MITFFKSPTVPNITSKTLYYNSIILHRFLFDRRLKYAHLVKCFWLPVFVSGIYIYIHGGRKHLGVQKGIYYIPI